MQIKGSGLFAIWPQVMLGTSSSNQVGLLKFQDIYGKELTLRALRADSADDKMMIFSPEIVFEGNIRAFFLGNIRKIFLNVFY